MKQKILFLNPPSPDGRLYNRHVMDPHVSKGDYLYPPYDFLLQSGFFAPHDGFSLEIIDAIAMGFSADTVRAELTARAPDAILALIAPQSHKGDMAFLKEVAESRGVPIFVMGAVPHARRGEVLERNPWIKGVLIDPISSSLRDHLDGASGPLPSLLLPGLPALPDLKARTMSIPMPRHELLPLTRYRYPAMWSDRFTSVLSSYGCPFQCTYCEAPGFGFRQRPAEETLEELKYVASLGVKEVCFKDWTFAANRAQTEDLLKRMIDARLDLHWFTFSRADVLDRDLIKLVKRAGCHTLQIGVESAQTDALKKYQRKMDAGRLREVFRACREEGVSTLATLILGIEGDDEAGIDATIKFVLELDPDYASFNIMTPLLGSKLREDWESQGLVDRDDYEGQDSTRAVVGKEAAHAIGNSSLSPARLEQLRNQAIRRFYFRPSYIARRVSELRSPRHFLSQARVGISLFRSAVLGAES